MGKSRRANSVLFGFDFQVNAAIVLMLENMKEMDSLRLESDLEDIEIFLSNGKSGPCRSIIRGLHKLLYSLHKVHDRSPRQCKHALACKRA